MLSLYTAQEVVEVVRVAGVGGDGAHMVEDRTEGFKAVDRAGNGFIAAAEIWWFFEDTGELGTDEEVDEAIRGGDVNGDFKISQEEFAVGELAKKVEGALSEPGEEFFEDFRAYDINSNGFISIEELRQARGNEITGDEAHEMIREAHVDGEGQISHAELAQAAFDEDEAAEE